MEILDSNRTTSTYDQFRELTPEGARQSLIHASFSTLEEIPPYLTRSQYTYCYSLLPPEKANKLKEAWDRFTATTQNQ